MNQAMRNYSEFSDPQLVDLLKSGDRDAFAEIYSRYRFILHNHAWNTQDLVQDVFSMIWAKRETLNIGSNLSGYLYTCINNQFLNNVVHKTVRDKYTESVIKFTEKEPVITDHRVRENMLQALIDKEIAKLPERMREVFELSRKRHLSNKEIAEIMGTSELTVKKQMGYALKILRKKLGLVLFLASYMVFHHSQ
jgi:RNA polymerase sigma-70 factor (family 1)